MAPLPRKKKALPRLSQWYVDARCLCRMMRLVGPTLPVYIIRESGTRYPKEWKDFDVAEESHLASFHPFLLAKVKLEEVEVKTGEEDEVSHMYRD
jgi:hypothetical protein